MDYKEIFQQLPPGFWKIAYPRPFFWKPFVYWRRATYVIITLIMLVICIILPIINAIQDNYHISFMQGSKELIYWGYLIFGAAIIFGFVQISLEAFNLFDKCKKLAREGILETASILWVMWGRESVVLTYRFWDLEGREHQRETAIPVGHFTNQTVPSAGDLLPVLFNPRKADTFNLLWIEIEQYVKVR
jgi:uncharacterized membrane protein (DUF485 family)